MFDTTKRYFIDAFDFDYYLIPVELHEQWTNVFLCEFYGPEFQEALNYFEQYKIDSGINDYEIVLIKKKYGKHE